MNDTPVTFRLVGGKVEVLATPLSDVHWRIVRSTHFRPGDVVCSEKLVPWRLARKRQGLRRTKVNPGRLVLLKEADEAKSDEDVIRLLAYVAGGPFPEPPTPAA